MPVFASGTAAAQAAAVLPIALAYLALFALLVQRARRRPGGERIGLGHAIPFGLGVAALFAVAVPPISTGADELLSLHMVQHVVLADAVPALIVLGLRSPLLSLGLPKAALRLAAPGGRLGRVTATLTNPWLVVPLWGAAQILWSLPFAMEATQASSALHLVQHATLFYAGILLWWIVIDPLGARRHRPRFARLAVLGASRGVTAAVCLPLTFLPTELYPAFAATTAARGLDPVVDQRLAGAAMCFLELVIFGAAFLAVFLSALAREEREDAVRRRAAGSAA